MNNIALSLTRLGRYQEALERLDAAMEIENRLGDKPGMALSLNNLGIVYDELGRDQESLESYTRALQVRREIGDRQGIASCLHNIGRIHAQSATPAAALPFLLDALRVSQEIEVKEIERDTHLALSDAYDRLDDPARALAAYKRYKAVNDDLFDQETSRRLAEQQARYDVEKKNREIAALRETQQTQRMVRNVTLGGSVLLVLLILLLYNRYRLKDRASREMRKANEALKQVQAEREKAMRAELAHVGRVATFGELAAALAHELNQPLTAILSNAQATQRLLKAEPQDRTVIDGAVTDIVDGAGRAREIIQRLRALIRRGELMREEVNPNRLLRDIEAIARADAASRGVELRLDLAEKMPTVEGDRIQIQQVVLNLVINGAEAMAGVSEGTGELVLTTRSRSGESVLVAVRDSGAGLDDETMRRMFEPFFTTKSEGMGMGLAICSSIIEAHGGRLWAERNPDRGTTVSFTLPQA